jgi:hypothetical protein
VSVIEIPLTQGKVALVDDEDAELVGRYRWWVDHDWPGLWYARTAVPCPTNMSGVTMRSMHRLILDPPVGVQVDHRNGNGLDNRRSNLRLATAAQNQHNQHARRGGSSRFKGVDWNLARRKWRAHVKVNGRKRYLGSFDDELDAAAMYDWAAGYYHGEFACVNGVLDVPEGR